MSCPHQNNYRPLEDSIHTDFKDNMSYGDYLNLEQILSAQHPQSKEHDEMLFIVIHQASELWIKLAGHELAAAIRFLEDEQFGPAFKVISRVKQIFIQLTQSWNILSTLTPVDYLKFRDDLGQSSGFQSYGYRKIEFMLGNKNQDLIKVHKANPSVHDELMSLSESPSLYDVVIKIMDKRGFEVDKELLERDFNQPYSENDSVLNAWVNVYQNAEKHFELYELAEKLMDIEDSFQNWRFKHMYTVQRIIGNKAGTGGSSGVAFLKKALEISFFPELLSLRTKL
ncbi:tryptophan 2,3-dioxygenase [Psychrosphaera haliotis]|uniref:Tryptophan 2,3-dioxygenase n=1 Tax=Psychrosphaera haliotis TaxID=555083 RepID=A0A6N8F4Q9_9GAMM|nr:tryptophan 2,3-dioxygenase [Psychrosphaera haliotis]MUH71144.1 tryptophan 2,3-dioxygenase [Psychrosphaera haliotis]